MKRPAKSAVDLYEEAVYLLKRAPASALAAYYAGSLPFVLGFLFFWADMSQSAFAYDHCAPAALGLALLFTWMMYWQAIFVRELDAELSGAPAPASTKPIAPYVPGHAVALPAPQTVHAVVPAELAHPRPAAAGVEKPGAPAARTPEAKEVPANQAMRAAPKPEPNPAMTMKKEAEPAHQPPHPANNLKEEQDAAAKKRAADAAEANKTKAEAAAEADKKKAEAAEEANKKKAEAAADANKKKAEVAEANKQKADSAADANKKKADAAAEAKKQAAEKAAAEKAAAEKRKENPPQ